MEKLFRFTAYVMGLVVVVMLVQSITQTKMEKLREGQMLSSPDIVSIKTRERQLECLAMNIYREAGHENFEGKVAVAQVTMNSRRGSSCPPGQCRAPLVQKCCLLVVQGGRSICPSFCN